MKSIAITILAILICQPITTFAGDPGADVREILKVSPKDVLRVREALQETQEAKYVPLESTDEWEVLNDTTELSLSPGEGVPTIYLGYLQPTNIEFVDITGSPWPVKDVKTFNKNFVDPKKVEIETGNSISLSPLLPVGEAFVTVYLKSLPSAITYRVVTRNKKYHRVKQLKVMQLGPLAKVDPTNTQITAEAGMDTDAALLSAAYGVRPTDYRELQTLNAEVKAWIKGEDLILFTKLSPIAPGPVRIVTGRAGYRAYRMPNSSRVVFTNEVGGIVEIRITEVPVNVKQ